MKNVFLSVFLPVLILSAGLLTSRNLNAQSAKKQALAEEKMEADALALSFVNCRFKLLQYEWGQHKNNKKMANELYSIARLRVNMTARIWKKYRGDETKNKKFTKALAHAEEQLTVCLKYQNIMNALDKKNQQSKTDKPG